MVSSALTEKERFFDTLLGDGNGRFPYFDLEPMEGTIERWRREGLPSDCSAAEFFRLETHHPAGLMLRSFPYFQGASDLLSDPASFEKHYHPNHPGRLEADFKRKCRSARKKGKVVYADAWGGGFLQMLGVNNWDSFVSAMYALRENPSRIESLVDRTTDFYCLLLDSLLTVVPIDYATFYEPIASNSGPVISPVMFRHFVIPGYRKVLKLLALHAVPLRILCTTGGDLSALLPDLVEAGINGFWISNICSTKMIYSELRRTYGPDIALIGGIDSTCLETDESAIRRTVEGTVPELLREGHYLPCLDDRPRSNHPFPRYRYFRQLLEEIALSHF
ncbi:MAG: uroporphyrinogen decarboxylase family protein [Acidobacteriota bacterium]